MTNVITSIIHISTYVILNFKIYMFSMPFLILSKTKNRLSYNDVTTRFSLEGPHRLDQVFPVRQPALDIKTIPTLRGIQAIFLPLGAPNNVVYMG